MDALEVVRSSDGPGRFEPRYNIGPSEPPRPTGSQARLAPAHHPRADRLPARRRVRRRGRRLAPHTGVGAGRSAQVQHRQCALRGDGGQACVPQRLEARTAMPDIRQRVLRVAGTARPQDQAALAHTASRTGRFRIRRTMGVLAGRETARRSCPARS